MEEIYKDIEGYEGLYQVSNLGNVKSLNFRNTNKEGLLKLGFDKDKYLRVSLNINGFKKLFGVHRLVATTFIPNPENKPQVNHIDGDKTNNNISNLEFCTAQYNTQHAFNIGLKVAKKGKEHYAYGKKGKEHHSSKIIYQYTIQGDFIKKWNSLIDAYNELNINKSDISTCAKGKLKTAGGFKWFYTPLHNIE